VRSHGTRDTGHGTWAMGHGQWDMGNGTWDTGHGHVTSLPIGDSTSRLDPCRLSRFRDRILTPRYCDPGIIVLGAVFSPHNTH
jgi:hypothetical protein